MVHSGLHSMKGFPFKPGWQVHEAALFWARHCALRPQGEGLHGSIISGRGEVAKMMISLNNAQLIL